MTQNNLGNALRAQAGLAEEKEAARLLAQAVDAYHAALDVYTKEQTPSGWATTQNSLGIALRSQAGLVGGKESARLLTQAVFAYHAALEVRTKDNASRLWAMTQNNLGNALWAQADLAEGKEAGRLLAQAVFAYHAALEIYTKDSTPQQWATVERNLEHALQSLQKLKKQAPAKDNMAHLLVLVPKNAELWFNGTKTKQTGAEREFVSPALTPGKRYSYELKAQWTENGKTVEQTRTVHVQTNTWQRIDFTKTELSADFTKGGRDAHGPRTGQHLVTHRLHQSGALR